MMTILRRFSALMQAKRLEIILVVSVALVYGYFFGCGGWNQNARLNTIFAFVEPGTDDFLSFHFDRFMVDPWKGYNTGDWSFYGGHFYSNKAPGTTLLGIPFYTGIFLLEKLCGISVDHHYVEILNAYLINFFVSVLPVSLGILFFYKLLLLKGLSLKKSIFCSLILAFGTCVFPYSTELWGHTTAMAFLVFALYQMEKNTRTSIFLAGLFAGFATLTDYLALLMTVTSALYILTTNHKKIFYFIGGGLFPLMLMLGYHYICFGNIFHTSTTFTNPLFLEKQRVLGMFGTVVPSIFMRLLFSLERGLLVSMPILFFAFPGFCFLMKKDKHSAKTAAFALASVILMLLVNSSFNGWHGGHSACARYQIVALPFWILLVSGVPWQKKWSIPLAVSAALSTFNMLAIAAVCVQPPMGLPNPIYGAVYSQFFRGNLNVLDYPIRLQQFSKDWNLFADATSFNCGELVGLRGLFSLLPLLVIVVMGARMIRVSYLAEKRTKNDA
jgi:hypothetical protein